MCAHEVWPHVERWSRKGFQQSQKVGGPKGAKLRRRRVAQWTSINIIQQAPPLEGTLLYNNRGGSCSPNPIHLDMAWIVVVKELYGGILRMNKHCSCSYSHHRPISPIPIGSGFQQDLTGLPLLWQHALFMPNGKPHVKRGLTPGWLASPWSNCPWVHDLYYCANNSRFEFSKDFAPFESIWGVSQTATFQSNVLPSEVGIQNVWMCFKTWRTQYDISQMFNETRFPNNVSSSVAPKRTIEDLEPNNCNVLLKKSQETYYSKSLFRVSWGIFPWDPHSPTHGIEAWAAAVGHLGCRKSLRRDPGEDGGDGAGLITSQWMAGFNYFLWFITWYLYTVWKTWI